MNRFEKKGGARGNMLKSILLPVLFFFLTLYLFSRGLTSVSQITEQEQKKSLERALMRSIIHCYGTEGAYPESLSDLLERYPITYDKDKFFVDYQPVGQNVMPDVTIISKTNP